ncbi:MAG: hypothetical protein PHC88_07675 [Terrimicrobiaceae bacterium]|nr:hypothetical protein [Terrimicrobiaceae bacterium]
MSSIISAFLTLALAVLLSLGVQAQEPPASTGEPAVPAETAPASELTEAIRYVNLLAYRGEARILLDGKIAVSNTMSGDIAEFTAITPGAHRIEIVPRHGAGHLLTTDFQVAPRSRTTLILVGGNPTGVADRQVPIALPLVADTRPVSPRPRQPQPGEPPLPCKLILVNTDMRGPLRITAKSGDQSKDVDLASGKTAELDPWPIGPLETRVLSLFRLASGDPATAELDLFKPEKPITYYCIYYATGATSPIHVLYLAAQTNGGFGYRADESRQ